MHDEQVRFLKPLGRHPCAHFREKDEERILNSLGLDVVLCPFCNRRCRSHQKLVSHCKRHHCKSLALKCSSCDKVFSDSYAPKVHMRLHSSTGRIHKCHVCNRAYLTKSKLNDHSKLHITGKPQCEYCDKLLADTKLLADHKKVPRSSRPHRRGKKAPQMSSLLQEVHAQCRCTLALQGQASKCINAPRQFHLATRWM